jgi:hypothetical protein
LNRTSKFIIFASNRWFYIGNIKWHFKKKEDRWRTIDLLNFNPKTKPNVKPAKPDAKVVHKIVKLHKYTLKLVNFLLNLKIIKKYDGSKN